MTFGQEENQINKKILSIMAFFYDHLSPLSGFAQYVRYLDNDLYIRNLKKYSRDPLNYQLLEIKRTIGESASASIENSNSQFKATQKHFEDLTTAVCGSLEKGFGQVVAGLDEIGWKLGAIDEGINDLHSMLDWKTDIMIEEHKISNFYLGKIASLLRIPESQKQRSYHVEQGITYLKNAIDEGPKSDFYTDALEEFSKAKEIEGKDFFCLNKLGLIHLNSVKHLDVNKADEYFRLSTRYAKANSSNTPGLLIDAALSLNYSSRCNYIQTDFSKAIELARQALELQPNNPEFGLQLAKCLSANKQEEEAAKVISSVIQLDKYYSMKVLSDQDFIGKPVIIDTVEGIVKNLINEVTNEIKELRPLIVNIPDTSDPPIPGITDPGIPEMV